MVRLPLVITHIYDPARGPLRNLCDLDDDMAETILEQLRNSGTRRIRANYLARRRATEAWLVAEARRKLGRLARPRPLYFFLGDFADGRDESRPCSLVMPLAAIPAGALTFTYPDSMASLPLATRDAHRLQRRPYHGQVFTLLEISEIVDRHGLPRRDSGSPHDLFIEVQVWDERPLRAFRPGSQQA